MIQELVRRLDKEELNRISQHPIWNAWYDIEFGSHDDAGIHGATPIEPLHWIQLGQFKYTRESFEDQVGKKSKLNERVNKVAQHIGMLLQRQSDRNMPRTTFSRGILTGHLGGHEMTGMMLLLSATLQCTAGRNALLNKARGKQKTYFENEDLLKDWSLLVETQLQFEEWLKLKSMPVTDVEKAKMKVRELMGIFRQVGKRKVGLGCNTMNFHGTIHAPPAILNYGVPSNINSFANERHHKRDKKTAQRTQKRPGECHFHSATVFILPLTCQNFGLRNH